MICCFIFFLSLFKIIEFASKKKISSKEWNYLTQPRSWKCISQKPKKSHLTQRGRTWIWGLFLSADSSHVLCTEVCTKELPCSWNLSHVALKTRTPCGGGEMTYSVKHLPCMQEEPSSRHRIHLLKLQVMLTWACNLISGKAPQHRHILGTQWLAGLM